MYEVVFNLKMDECKINYFCFVCGHFIKKKGQHGEGVALTDLFVDMYEKYYEDERVNRSASWVPDHCCKNCYSRLRIWWNYVGDDYDSVRMPYGKPMMWSLVDPGEHDPQGCYGCSNYVHGMRQTDKNRVYHATLNCQLP